MATNDVGSPGEATVPGRNWAGWTSLGLAALAWLCIVVFVLGPWNAVFYVSFLAMLASIGFGLVGLLTARGRPRWQAILGLVLSLMLTLPFIQTVLFVISAG